MDTNFFELIFRFSMTLCVVILSISLFNYYMEENVMLKSSFISGEGPELPSFTTCYRFYDERFKPDFGKNASFDDFMDQEKDLKNYILEAEFLYTSPINKTRTSDNLLDKKYDKYWKASYYLQAQGDHYYGISRCITLDSPIEKLEFPNDLWVRKSYFLPTILNLPLHD